MKKLLIVLLLVLFAFTIVGCSDDPAGVFQDGTESSIDPGTYIEYAESSECTPEALASWYKNDILDKGYNVGIIIYTDMDDAGIHAANNVISKNVVIEDDAYVDNMSDTVIYTYEDGQLKE